MVYGLILSFYDKNAILSKESGSTRSQNLQERFGNILRIAPLVEGRGVCVKCWMLLTGWLVCQCSVSLVDLTFSTVMSAAKKFFHLFVWEEASNQYMIKWIKQIKHIYLLFVCFIKYFIFSENEHSKYQYVIKFCLNL